MPICHPGTSILIFFESHTLLLRKFFILGWAENEEDYFFDINRAAFNWLRYC